MILSGTTILSINGKTTRVCGKRFNAALKSQKPIAFFLETGEIVTPSKGLSWIDVANMVRAGKKVQASASMPGKPHARKSAPKLAAAA